MMAPFWQSTLWLTFSMMTFCVLSLPLDPRYCFIEPGLPLARPTEAGGADDQRRQVRGAGVLDLEQVGGGRRHRPAGRRAAVLDRPVHIGVDRGARAAPGAAERIGDALGADVELLDAVGRRAGRGADV